MKPFTLIALVALLAGCASEPEVKGASETAKDPFVEKLNSLPESERAEYARTHAAEAMASANPGAAPASK
ncbi:MAG: hypothetical protein ACO1SV_06555 [Fimbriimonas sp.]